LAELKKHSDIYNVDLVMGSSHRAAVGCVANVVYICAASTFRIKVSRVCNCLGYLCIDPADGGSTFLSNVGNTAHCHKLWNCQHRFCISSKLP